MTVELTATGFIVVKPCVHDERQSLRLGFLPAFLSCSWRIERPSERNQALQTPHHDWLRYQLPRCSGCEYNNGCFDNMT